MLGAPLSSKAFGVVDQDIWKRCAMHFGSRHSPTFRLESVEVFGHITCRSLAQCDFSCVHHLVASDDTLMRLSDPHALLQTSIKTPSPSSLELMSVHAPWSEAAPHHMQCVGAPRLATGRNRAPHHVALHSAPFSVLLSPAVSFSAQLWRRVRSILEGSLSEQ